MHEIFLPRIFSCMRLFVCNQSPSPAPAPQHVCDFASCSCVSDVECADTVRHRRRPLLRNRSPPEEAHGPARGLRVDLHHLAAGHPRLHPAPHHHGHADAALAELLGEVVQGDVAAVLLHDGLLHARAHAQGLRDGAHHRHVFRAHPDHGRGLQPGGLHPVDQETPGGADQPPGSCAGQGKKKGKTQLFKVRLYCVAAF